MPETDYYFECDHVVENRELSLPSVFGGVLVVDVCQECREKGLLYGWKIKDKEVVKVGSVQIGKEKLQPKHKSIDNIDFKHNIICHLGNYLCPGCGNAQD